MIKFYFEVLERLRFLAMLRNDKCVLSFGGEGSGGRSPPLPSPLEQTKSVIPKRSEESHNSAKKVSGLLSLYNFFIQNSLFDIHYYTKKD